MTLVEQLAHVLQFSCKVNHLYAQRVSTSRVNTASPQGFPSFFSFGVSFLSVDFSSMMRWILQSSCWALSKSIFFFVDRFSALCFDSSSFHTLAEVTITVIHGLFATLIAWADWYMVFTVSSGMLSVHSGIYLFISNGILEKLSASMWHFPGWYLILQLKSASSPTLLSPVAFNLALDKTYVSRLLSVNTVKFFE